MKTYNREEAADILKCDPSTVSELLQSGALAGAQVGRAWVIREDDLDAFLREVVNQQTGGRLKMAKDLLTTVRRRRPLPALP